MRAVSVCRQHPHQATIFPALHATLDEDRDDAGLFGEQRTGCRYPWPLAAQDDLRRTRVQFRFDTNGNHLSGDRRQIGLFATAALGMNVIAGIFGADFKHNEA